MRVFYMSRRIVDSYGMNLVAKVGLILKNILTIYFGGWSQ